ncbi:MAG: NlpC/P60 family protein [Actinomycetota bacterium]
MRLFAAAVLTVSMTVTASTVSLARPSKHDLDVAQAKYDALNEQLSLFDEQYNQARLELQQVQRQLADAKAAAEAAQAEANEARDLLSARAVAAYTGSGSQLEVLLGATTFAEFADRLEFVTQVAQSDADVAAQAEVSRQKAVRATQTYNAALDRQRSIVSKLGAKKAEMAQAVAEQQELVRELKIDLEKQAREAREAREAARRAAAAETAPIPSTGGGGNPGPPPSVSGGAAAAVEAAYSVLGVPYQWGGSSPESGFDCSGLTMWSWAHGGVSLPHSSSAQYYSLPHVSVSNLQPGDLVFFYTPIHHVGIYVGGDQMIHAPHSGSYVHVTQFSTYPEFVGAARPG